MSLVQDQSWDILATNSVSNIQLYCIMDFVFKFVQLLKLIYFHSQSVRLLPENKTIWYYVDARNYYQ